MGVADIFAWLFGTRQGVVCLLGIGLVGFLIAAIVLERKTRSDFDQEDESESEDGWSFFDDDNN